MTTARTTTSPRPTLSDVARHCGLSPTTVSRAISGQHERYRIPADTSRRAVEAARALGYRANWSARTLAKRKCWQVGLFFRYSIPEFRGIYEHLMQGLTERLEAAGYSLLFVPLHGQRWRDILRDQRLDAVAVADPMIEGMDVVLAEANLPTVMLNTLGVGLYDEVLPDDVQGTELAVRHLHDLGHRRIAYYHGGAGARDAHFSVAVREEAFKAGAAQLGIGGGVTCIETPTATDLLDRVTLGPGGYTAVVTYSHLEATRLLAALHARGLRVPHDVSIVAFNDIFPMSDLSPAMTTVAVPGGDIGRCGARMLLDQLEGLVGDGDESHESQEGPRRVTLPETLVIRGSTAAPHNRLVAGGGGRGPSPLSDRPDLDRPAAGGRMRGGHTGADRPRSLQEELP